MAKTKDKNKNRYIITQLGKKACLRWMVDVSMDWIFIAATFYLVWLWNNPVGYVLAIFIIGIKQHALAILGHDGTHYTIHKDRSVNNVLSDFFALMPIGLTTSGYRNLHFKHHQHLNTERDPELMHRSSKAPQWDLPITPPKVLKLAIMDLFGYSISDYWMIVSYSKAQSKWSYVIMFLMHAAFIISFVMLGLFWIPLIWYYSLITTFMMFFRLRTWLEHQGSEDTHRLKLNWLERAILAPHNVWHHYEHHAYPTVSYSRLHLVREQLDNEPVITLRDLIINYSKISEIPSGQPTRAVR